MKAGGPLAGSALRVALRRAAHQLVDRPVVFRDPYAVPLLAGRYGAELRRTPSAATARRAHESLLKKDRPWSRALRAYAVARSCYAEQLLALAVAQGVRQYCLLGAGLDTFAWRNPYPELQVWEVDRPAMLAWKQELAAEAGFAAPARCCSVAADLSDAKLPARLAEAGLDARAPMLFALLGVAPYLNGCAFTALAAMVRAWAPGSGLVLDYRLPRAALDEEEQRQHDSMAARVAAAGEPFQSAWTPEEMAAEFGGLGPVEQLGSAAINARYFADRSDGLLARGDAWRVASVLGALPGTGPAPGA